MSVADTSPPLKSTLINLINLTPAAGFVVLGDTSQGGTVTHFARAQNKVWAVSQDYGRGRAPFVKWENGEVELLEVLIKTVAELGNETNYTWQAWDAEVPLGDDPNCHSSKVYIGFIFSGRNGVVAPPARRMF